jgi:hypothetical protein
MLIRGGGKDSWGDLPSPIKPTERTVSIPKLLGRRAVAVAFSCLRRVEVGNSTPLCGGIPGSPHDCCQCPARAKHMRMADPPPHPSESRLLLRRNLFLLAGTRNSLLMPRPARQGDNLGQSHVRRSVCRDSPSSAARRSSRKSGGQQG